MSFTHKASITIDHTKCGTADTTSFPMLVSGTYDGTGTEPDLRSASNGGNVTSESGYDICFYSDAGLTTKLNHEIEKYVAATGEIIMWVQIPTLHYGTNDVIYMAYGDAGITTNQSTTATWSSDYKGVWHANQASGNILDSTSNDADFVATGSPTYAQAGKVGVGVQTAKNSDYFTVTNAGLAFNNTDFTVEAWVKYGSISGENAIFCGQKTDGIFNGICWLVESSWESGHPFKAFFYDGTNWLEVLSADSTSTETFYHVVAVFDAGATLKLYVNSVEKGSLDISSYTIPQLTGLVMMGQRVDGGNGTSGIIDEGRISAGAKTQSYITASFNSQSSPSTFYAMGDETAITSSFVPKIIII